MNTLHDLRSTLDRHAEGLDDTERYVRPVAVRARVRAVRRRRAGVAGVAAVLVVIAGIAAADVMRGPDRIAPADRVVAGVDVPGSIELQGFPYDLTDLVDLTDDPTHVEPADHEEAVLLAASGLGPGSATLYSDGQAVARVRGDEQISVAYPVGDGGTGLQVRLHDADPGARAGVAVYEATGALASGIDNGSVVFRDEYAGEPLLGAAFAEPGRSSVEFQARGAAIMRYVFYCDGPDSLFINVDVDGRPGLASSCGSSGVDAANGTSGTLDGLDPSRDHAVRVYLTRGSDGPEVAPSDVTFGAGVYASGYAGQRVQGQDVARAVEYAGRTWVLDSAEVAPLDIDAPDDVLIGVIGSGPALRATWTGRLSHGGSSSISSPDRGTSTLGGVLLGGDRYDVTLRGGEGRVLVYRPE
ncbi:hypothetical protein [Nocardioides sp. URHA0020]|uniref:hypothetical protein n=1 Tax=Nocardioides sp. URHA0020 TaxID=1380392 RepID=UPI00048B098A|nr:hypothetical protein [Nocardioides sp. URHA0020]